MAAQSNKVLVLGAGGGIGGEVARQLRDGGWQVQALKRGLATAAEQRDGIQWLRGDALNRDDVVRAARGCSVIVHGVNPPGYRHWAEQVLPMIDNTIAAARIEGATVVLPGTVYNYGPDAFAELNEQAVQRPLTRKGRIRVELEHRLQDATRDGVRAIVVRSGDFFGPRAGNSWFSQGMIKPGQAVKVINLPSDPGVGHQWAYLPDVARTMVELVVRRGDLPPFATFHMEGYWDADGTQIAAAISRVVERAGGQTRLRRFPWWLVGLASPLVTTFREMLEMRYLWRTPVRMNNAYLLSVLGAEPHTPLDQAVEVTLKGVGCL
ncbi:MAG: NAD-dependent epimerase/dehydratase family protein [Pseudomonas gingeri]